ncbi:MAG: hypothetical protein AABY22_09225 [Nanoarchaeota archaeon]
MKTFEITVIFSVVVEDNIKIDKALFNMPLRDLRLSKWNKTSLEDIPAQFTGGETVNIEEIKS